MTSYFQQRKSLSVQKICTLRLFLCMRNANIFLPMSSNEENKLRIHTVIGGFRFPMIIDREDEEIYRNAEKQVNRYIDDYQKQYLNLSAEEIRSLVAFQLAVVIYKTETNQSIDPVIEKIQSLDNEFEKILNAR